MNIAIMGFGVVGSGVAEVITNNQDNINRKSMQDSLDIKYILDLRDFPDSPFADRLIKDFNIILNDDSVKIVVETMGGVNPAYSFVSSLLKKGKSVVTSNKELVAKKGFELLSLAKENNVNFLFEASVGGGIPIIRPINQCLAANRISCTAGILNGTTNFILTKMITDNTDFDTALKMAQQLGYAEKDPTADVDGFDACRKICILASLCFGIHIYPDNIKTEGIRGITLRDVEYAGAADCVIKLLGITKMNDDGKVLVFVAPCFVKRTSQLAGVNDVFNAILVRGDALGDVVFYGKGAGKLPTASAVVADVIDCAKHTEKRIALNWEDGNEDIIADAGSAEFPFYVRGTADGKAKEDIEKALGTVKYLSVDSASENEIAFITDAISENALVKALDGINGFTVLNKMRVTDF